MVLLLHTFMHLLLNYNEINAKRNIHFDNFDAFKKDNFYIMLQSGYCINHGVGTQQVSESQGNVHRSNGSLNFHSTQSLGIITAQPKHPDYAIKSVRRQSFRTWPTNKTQSPEDLADAGLFYSGDQDAVFCFYCGKGLKNWEDGDVPWFEHARWYPDCPFVQTVKGHGFVMQVQEKIKNHNNVLEHDSPINRSIERTPVQETGPVFEDQNNNPAMESLILNGYDKVFIRKALEIWKRDKDVKPYHAVDILDIVFKIEDGEMDIDLEEEVQNSRHPTDIDCATGLEKNKNCEKMGRCKICRREFVSVVFLPCGHLSCCTDCAPACRTCCTCGQFIKGTVRTYLA